jgi:hypothetical protein
MRRRLLPTALTGVPIGDGERRPRVVRRVLRALRCSIRVLRILRAGGTAALEVGY